MAPDDALTARRLLDPVDERPAARSLAVAVQRALAGTPRSDALELLQELGPLIRSDELILAASLIRGASPAAFDRVFREAVAEAAGQCSDTHLALLDLRPRGILTFNYDGGHEEACHRRGQSYLTLNPIDERSEAQFRHVLEARLEGFFLLKAHGSTDSTRRLVLTNEEYRDLLAKNPSYRAFVQNLFTNFNFLMVGYGLDDPDFALFLATMAEQFAGPLQQHVVIRPVAQRHRREEVERRLYGIRTLHVNDFHEIPAVLALAATTPGPALRRLLGDCLSPSHGARELAHRSITSLGPAGRAVACSSLLMRLSDPDTFVVSEAAYTIGLLDARGHKARLCQLVDTTDSADIVGRTLTVLRSTFDLSDLPRLSAWRAAFAAIPPAAPRDERIATYLDYLLVYVESKYTSDPPATSVSSGP